MVKMGYREDKRWVVVKGYQHLCLESPATETPKQQRMDCSYLLGFQDRCLEMINAQESAVLEEGWLRG